MLWKSKIQVTIKHQGVYFFGRRCILYTGREENDRMIKHYTISVAQAATDDTKHASMNVDYEYSPLGRVNFRWSQSAAWLLWRVSAGVVPPPMTLCEVNSPDDSGSSGGQSARTDLRATATSSEKYSLEKHRSIVPAGIAGFHAPLIAGCQLDSRRGNTDVSRASPLLRATWVVALSGLHEFSDPTSLLSCRRCRCSSCKLVLGLTTSTSAPFWRWQLQRAASYEHCICGFVQYTRFLLRRSSPLSLAFISYGRSRSFKVTEIGINR